MYLLLFGTFLEQVLVKKSIKFQQRLFGGKIYLPKSCLILLKLLGIYDEL